jgi:protease-4
MARKRDVVVGIIIGFVFIVALVFFGLIFIGLMTREGDLELAGFGDNVGLIEIFGVMSESSGRPVIERIDKWADNSSIKAIVLHINSGGGQVAMAQELYGAVRRASEKKPVVAAMASVGASGAYYVSCAADRIVANPGTLTGSIGVILEFHTFGQLMDKIGVGTETVKSGKMKDVGSYSRSMTKEEELMLQSVIMDSYEQFVDAISEGRGMEKEDIYPLADGSIFTGLQAYNLGLIDTLGGLKEAVDLAAELAGIDGTPKVVRPYKKKRVPLLDLLGRLAETVDNTVAGEFSVGPQLLYLHR